jgi:Family of unknown function (DUF5519)
MAHDPVWLAVVELCEELGPVEHRPSRWADKPALFLGRREIAHAEAPGWIDLRITVKGWRAQASAFTGDPAVRHDPRRRDWVELIPSTAHDVQRLRPLFEQAITANS